MIHEIAEYNKIMMQHNPNCRDPALSIVADRPASIINVIGFIKLAYAAIGEML